MLCSVLFLNSHYTCSSFTNDVGLKVAAGFTAYLQLKSSDVGDCHSCLPLLHAMSSSTTIAHPLCTKLFTQRLLHELGHEVHLPLKSSESSTWASRLAEGTTVRDTFSFFY
ncbi:hypothetical protein TRVL_03116 [Trypanosoma vivax]|nr:hypothetical protein TRVL_03116 [Trypanosoma vivax]